MKFIKITFLLLISFGSLANQTELDLERTNNGYIVHSNVPSGVTSTTSFDDKSIKEASFRFAIEDFRGDDEWPAGANFSFFSEDRKSFFQIAFLTTSNTNDDVVVALKIVENGNVVGADTLPLESESLDKLSVFFRWDNRKVLMKINNYEETEIIAVPYDIDELVFGLQSSSGKIHVNLINKAV